jgi:hypothetical protein
LAAVFFSLPEYIAQVGLFTSAFVVVPLTTVAAAVIDVPSVVEKVILVPVTPPSKFDLVKPASPGSFKVTVELPAAPETSWVTVTTLVVTLALSFEFGFRHFCKLAAVVFALLAFTAKVGEFVFVVVVVAA